MNQVKQCSGIQILEHLDWSLIQRAPITNNMVRRRQQVKGWVKTNSNLYRCESLNFQEGDSSKNLCNTSLSAIGRSLGLLIPKDFERDASKWDRITPKMFKRERERCKGSPDLAKQTCKKWVDILSIFKSAGIGGHARSAPNCRSIHHASPQNCTIHNWASVHKDVPRKVYTTSPWTMSEFDPPRTTVSGHTSFPAPHNLVTRYLPLRCSLSYRYPDYEQPLVPYRKLFLGTTDLCLFCKRHL